MFYLADLLYRNDHHKRMLCRSLTGYKSSPEKVIALMLSFHRTREKLYRSDSAGHFLLDDAILSSTLVVFNGWRFVYLFCVVASINNKSDIRCILMIQLIENHVGISMQQLIIFNIQIIDIVHWIKFGRWQSKIDQWIYIEPHWKGIKRCFFVVVVAKIYFLKQVFL